MKKNVRSILISFLIIGVGAHKMQAQKTNDYILEMSLEEMLNMEITSVSKKSERLQDVASSIYVVNSEQIMQSGATTLHEVLRNVPGYWGVQDEYSSVYSSIRNSPPASSDAATVLYLLDGTPIQELMGSTFSFQNFDLPLDEIDRIEVIRGSGGTVYGANSATGVVSIFTKSPEKYDGINARVEAATPGYIAPSVRMGGAITDKLAISGYAKYRHFSGFESLAGKLENGDDNPYIIKSRFTKNYDESDYYSVGAKLNYKISENTKISGRLHYNARSQNAYTNSYDDTFVYTGTDILHTNDVNANRTVANLRLDNQFSENHTFFLRGSTSIENDFYKPVGGISISNAIYDIEMQDNFSLGTFNNIGVGLNYRHVKFDIHDVNNESQIQYLNPQSTETLTGAFIQDKISLLAGKINVTVGVKAENYSLVNDKYYLSPMAKFSYIATSNLTLWGGFTKSYTTPGFNNVNLDWFIYQAPPLPIAQAIVKGSVRQQALAEGASEEEAEAAAEGFLQSPQGQAVVGQIATNTAVKNGSKTVPTKFETFEFGLKTSFSGKIQFNTTAFFTTISDGVTVSNAAVSSTPEESPTQPGRYASYFTYGNYVKGQSMGVETMARIFPSSDLILEFSHTWISTDWEWQKNSDFDITGLQDVNMGNNVQFIPEHVFRFTANFTLNNGMNINAQVTQTTKFQTQSTYQFDNERHDNVLEAQFTGKVGDVVAKDDTRTIVNLRVEQPFLDKKMKIYVFGNDITNPASIEDTDNIRNVTLSQIGSMYGLGLNYKFN